MAFSGINPVEVKQQLGEFIYHGKDTYGLIKEAVETLNEDLLNNWWSPNVEEFNGKVQNDIIPTANDMLENYRNLAIRAENAANILMEGHGRPDKIVTEISILTGSIATQNLLEERANGDCGIMKDNALSLKNEFVRAISTIRVKIESTPTKISFYDPQDMLMTAYKDNIIKDGAKINEDLAAISNMVNNAIEHEVDLSNQAVTDARAALGG